MTIKKAGSTEPGTTPDPTREISGLVDRICRGTNPLSAEEALKATGASHDPAYGTTAFVLGTEQAKALKRLARIAELLKLLCESPATLAVKKDVFERESAKFYENLITIETKRLRLCALAEKELSAAAKKIFERVNRKEEGTGK